MDAADIRKSILIIKSSPRSLTAVETFLRNREWKIHSTTDLKPALQYLIAQKPSFVMVCVDHPDRKVRGLPKLLIQAFPALVMVFVETNNSSSYKALVDSGINYRINSPVTGPAVERTINKILRDMETDRERSVAVEKAAQSARNLKSDVENIRRRQGEGVAYQPQGGKEKEPGSFSIGGDAGGRGQDYGFGSGDSTQRLSDDSPVGDDDTAALLGMLRAASQEAQQDSSMASFSSTEAGELAAPLLAGGENSSASSSLSGQGDAMPFSSNPGGGSLMRTADGTSILTPESLSGEGRHGGGTLDPAAALTSNKATEPWSDSNTAMGLLLDPRGPSRRDQTALGDLFTKGPANQRLRPGANGSDAEALLRGGESLSTSLQPPEWSEGETPRFVVDNGWHKEENLILRGIQKALDECVSAKSAKPGQKIDVLSQLTCLIVQSKRFSGYLVAALGGDRLPDAVFFDVVHQRLSTFLKEHGEPIREEKAFPVKVGPVHFGEWTFGTADFLRNSIHEGDEIAMAFFSCPDIDILVEGSPRADMGAIPLEALRADARVEFDVYMYLPANRRYVLYTPRGAKFYLAQKDRLARLGFKQMHVKRTALGELGKYRAQNFLDESVEAFEAQQGKRNAG